MEAVIAIVGTFVGAAITVLSQFVAHRRDDRRESRQQREQRIAALSAMYQEAMYILERNVRSMSLVPTEEANSSIRFMARFRLECPPDILRQYLVAGSALDAWAIAAREAAPKSPAPGVFIISSHDKTRQEKADALYPAYQEASDKVERMMRENLDALQNGVPGSTG